MFQINITSNYNELIIPTSLKLKQSALEEIAKLVYESIQLNIQQGKNPNGGSLAPNKPSTLKSKKGTLLYETGQLYNSIQRQKINEDLWEVFINGERSNVAKYLEEGRSDMQARIFFAGGNTVEQQVKSFLANTSFENLFDVGK